MKTSTSTDKWERMQAIVDQHAHLPQFNPRQGKTKIFLMRLLAENILTFLLQYSGLMFSTLTPQHFPIWFATGTACAFIFLRGISVLPGIWLGSFVAFYFAHSGMTTALVCASIFALQAYALLISCYRFSGPTLYFSRKILFIKFILCSAIITAVTSFALQVFMPFQTWLVSWLANMNGIFIVACAIVTWDAYFPELYQLKKYNRLLISLLYGLLITLSIMTLLTGDPLALAAIMSLTLVIALIYGWCGVMAAVFTSGLLFSLGAGMSAPFFHHNPPALIITQIMLCAETLLALSLVLEP